MMRHWIAIVLLIPALREGIGASQEERDRSPADVALSPDGRWAVTANATSDSSSLVDLAEGVVVAEISAGRRPFAVALSRNGKRAVVTNWLSGSITLLDVAPPRLTAAATLVVGREPRGVAISPDGARAFVALSAEDSVAIVDLQGQIVVGRVAVGREPWYVAITPDGKRLAVGNAFSQDVSVVDAEALKVACTVPMRGRNLRHIAISPDGAWAYLPHIADRGASTLLANIERGLVLDNRLGRVPLLGEGPREALALDTKGFGAGDLEGVAVSPDGERIAVSIGGTRHLIFLRLPLPFKAEPGDHIDPALHADKSRYRRVFGLKGRPMSLVFTPDGKSVVVANYLRNEIQIVDWETGNVTRSIPLGGPKEPSLPRRGEAIFYDADRSWHAWFSCHTCHTDGHTNGGLYDTFNDGKYGNPKKVLSLRGVTRTGPWTWHGHQNNLGQALQGSFTKTMAREPANDPDLKAILAFLATIDFVPPSGDPNSEGARRGEAVFKAKACDACHIPPDYTNKEATLVGLESPDDAFKGFNPPPLRGVSTRGPWLHDGRAKTLGEVLMKHHRPLKLNGKPDLTPEELADLLAFLKSL